MAIQSRYPETMAIDPTRVAVSRRALLLRLCVALAAALLATVAAASPASASPAIYDGISADGSIAVFSTEESLVPGDTDRQRDVYERSYDESLERYVTREVSIGPAGGNDALPAQYDAVSADGTKVFFSTREQLVAADEDHSTDIYMRNLTTNTTTLVSQGAASCQAEGCGNGAFDASFAPGGLSLSGEELFFVTSERLSPADHDNSPDIYMRDLATNTTTLVSQGAASCQAEGCGSQAYGVSFNAVSADGSTVAFSSNESLAPEDQDELQDVYVRDLATETTRLVSTPGTCAGGVDCKAVFGGISSDGSHVFFESSEQIAPGDTDESQDVYDWTPGGGAVLASTGPDGGNGPFNTTFAGSSADGSTVYFETSERIDPSVDTDETNDIYKRSGGVTELVSTGPEGGNGPYPASLHWVSPDGSAALFTTEERLTEDDTDAELDIYERAGSTTRLVSTGPEGGNGPFDASFAGASSDGSRVFFNTSERLVPEDQDSSSDIYVRSGGLTELVSTGPEGGNGAFSPVLAGVSHDGERAFFTTEERLTEGDVDAELDVYERSGSTTRLVSTGNLTALGPATPTLTATSPAAPGASMTPSILGQAAPGSWVKLYSSFDCSGEPAAQGTAAELSGEGIAVSVAEGSTTSFRATAEAEGLVSPCSAPISYKQESSPPPPPPPPPPAEEPGGGTTTGPGSGQGGGLGRLEEGRFRGGGGTGGSPYVAPHVLITFGPASKTRKRRVVLRFADATGQLGSSFACKLDRHHWRRCSSPKRLDKLSLGKHVFSVKAVNAVGVWDEQAAQRSFRVVR